MKRERVENRAGEKRNAGSFAWLESKEADKSVFSPLLFKQREYGKPHTLLENHKRKRRGKEENEEWSRGQLKEREQEWRGLRRKEKERVSPRC